jgi:regulator of protease activity HflC (stomatin/prohibitin superfamily)
MAPRAKDGAEPDGVWAQSAKIAFRFLFVAVAVIAAGWAVSNILQVPPDSRAVVLRFGSAVRQQEAGLLFAWPRPIEQVVVLPSADRQIQFRISRFDAAGGGPASTRSMLPGSAAGPAADVIGGFDMSDNPRQNAGFLLTGDSSVVHLQATLFYQIKDPVSYLISADHVGPALERLFVASAVAVCAARDLDTILVARPEASPTADQSFRTQREQLRTDLMNAVNRRLQDLAEQGAGLGVAVSRVDLVAAIPSGAKTEFDRVLIVTQSAEKYMAEARTAAEMAAQQANRDRDSIVAQAAAKAEERVNEARTRTAAIAALAREAPGLSRQTLINRLYFDRVGRILAKAASVEAIARDAGSHVIVPGPEEKWPTQR